MHSTAGRPPTETRRVDKFQVVRQRTQSVPFNKVNLTDIVDVIAAFKGE
jgi:hypothetical protein